MHLIKKIKAYFTKYEWHSWKNFDSNAYDIKFRELSDENIIDMVNYLKNVLPSTDQIANDRHRLKQEKSIECKTLDEVILLIKHIVAVDYNETSNESKVHNWIFQYFIGKHKSCDQTACLSNVLTSKSGNCIYTLVSIRRVKGIYYLWNHLN